MDNQYYDDRSQFLENLIVKQPENTELIKAYVKLIEKKADVEIQYIKGKEAVEKEREKYFTDRYKADTDIEKKQ